MIITRRNALTLAGSFAASTVLPAHAQRSFPQRPLRMLITSTPGSSSDIVGRALADKMTGPLGAAISVENHAGGGGGIAVSMVQNAPPDGHTMVLLNAGYATGAAVDKFKFEGDKSFACVTMVCSYPFVYSVPKDSPIKSFEDMLARAKANPDKLTYVITSIGAVHHLIGTWVCGRAGVTMVPVPYRGSSAAIPDVISGRVDVMLEPATSGMPRVQSGEFRVLAVTSPKRFELMPDAPTVAETLPGVHCASWLGMVATPGTPRDAVERLNKEIHAALKLPDTQQKLREGGNVAQPTTPDEMLKQMADEIAQWQKIIKDNNIKVT